MEKYGPLFHRNGAKIVPGPLSRLIIGLVTLVGVAELVLGIIVVVR
ncbi:hypothetical protein JI721_14435 [Alicyclobacillus cycloheptanicus]|uniref:Uncharacterized protein n=1 Tax=Alicyclobacillus cycloheptanicus TaxID=1457 RepID=A0ABT9XLT1_9BACL|nr:hypothetical protein [Alicyclobacillus cycloheptanicus]MCL6442306.1 hypothetical protein [Alicyclobacillus sp.]MDQ0191075.1 hypothetical protein [Alicyclobacillus cycloheptanicus]WDM00868.1 hypothetical protein JI721_14435 [Alicyclobacillus cycloheptanicus]